MSRASSSSLSVSRKLRVLMLTVVTAGCCRVEVSEDDLLTHLSGLELGDIKTIKFNNCPAPVNPLWQRLQAMGIVNLQSIKWLQYNNVPRSYGSSQSQFEGN